MPIGVGSGSKGATRKWAASRHARRQAANQAMCWDARSYELKVGATAAACIAIKTNAAVPQQQTQSDA